MSPYIPVDWSQQNEDEAAGAARSARAAFDQDSPCPSCGYNLRGVPLGNKCPECGVDPMGDGQYSELQLKAPQLRRLMDIMLAAGPAERRNWKFGLALAAACLGAVVVSRFVYLAAALSPGGPPEKQYLLVGAATSVAWAFAARFILPASIERHWPRLRTLRRAVLASQFLWMPAYAFWLMRGFGSSINGDLLIALHVLLRAIAGIGFIAMGQLLVFVCEEAELEHAARRLNTASWLVAFPTLLGQLFIGSLPWIALFANLLVLLWWAWMLAYYVLGFLGMRQHVVWAQRHRIEAAGRQHRVAAKKKAHEQMIERQIRPLPVDQGGDEPLAT